MCRKSGFGIDCMCVLDLGLFKVEVYHRLKCVSGTDLSESEMCCLCVECVHRTRCNIAWSTGVYFMRGPVLGLGMWLRVGKE